MEEKMIDLLRTQGAPAPTTTSAAPVQIPMLSPQQAPTNPNDMVNQAVAAGIKQGQRENAVQQINNEAAQEAQQFVGLPLQQAYNLGNLSNTRFAQREILKATQGFLEAQAAGDAEGMRAYNERANAIRDWTNANNIDMSAYGSDRTLAQKQAAYDMANQDRYAEILNTKDSGTFYNERFDFYKSIGLSDRGADKRAYNDAQEYRTKRLRTLQDELLANAINPRTGAINNYGVQLIGLMRDEDPDSITPFVTMMPGPNQDYVVNMSEYQKDNAFDRSIQAQNNQYAHQKDLQHDTIEAQLRKAAMDNETKRYIAGLPTAGKGGSPQDLTGLKKKGYDATQQILSTLSNIWSDPEYVATHKDDHRLKTCIDIANKALNEGAIDQTQHKNLMYKIRAAMGAVYGDANVDEWIKNWEKEHPDDELDKK